MKFNILILMLLTSICTNAQDCITINIVNSFTPGEGQNLGQGEEYYPANIFGIPSRVANEDVAEASESEVLSLGFGGKIVVGNSDFLIVDGEGQDFTIFENVFLNPITNRLFKEPAVISVSSDGTNFIEFPYDFSTLDGCAGTQPTFGNNNYCNPQISGGDSFDLSLIGADSIRYIKIKDITNQLKDKQSHKYFDFSLSGFDLDAVVIHNFVSEPITGVKNNISESYNIRNKSIISKRSDNTIKLFDIQGNLIKTYHGLGTFHFDLLKNGFFIIKITNNKGTFVEKIINL